MTELNGLRDEIRQIDYQIMDLLKRRTELASKVGEYKIENNLPIRNYQVERQVIQRAKERAKNLDIPEEIAQNITELLIIAAVGQQQFQRNQFSNNNISGKSCLIIGGKGKMGQWFGQFLQSSGHTITIEEKYDPVDSYDAFDIIFIATPMDVIPNILNKIKYKNPSAVIVDIASLKSHIIDDLYALHKSGLSVTSIHPMFGPDVKTLDGRNLLIASLGNTNADNEIMNLFADTAVSIKSMPLKDHDRFMSISLGLSHAINLIFGITIAESGIEYASLMDTASTTFLKQLKTTSEVFEENPDLYYLIQHYNDHRDEMYQQLHRSISRLDNAVKQTHGGKFQQLMYTVRDYFGGDKE